MPRVLSALVAVAAFGAVAGTAGGAQGAVLNPSPHGARAGKARPVVVAAPVAPFMTAVVPEGLAALASWTPSPSGDKVTGYTLTAAVAKGYTGPVGTGCAAPPPTQVPATDSSGLATALCPQVPYTITVTATNAAGTSAPSNPTNPVVPLAAQPPSAPLLESVTPREQSLIVTWSPPSLPGGDLLTGYTLTATAGSQTVTAHPGATATQATITGLSDGTAYRVSLSAHSKAGTSAAAQSSGTPSAPYIPAQPQDLQAVSSGSGGIAVSWLAPTDDGGDAITSYAITYQQEVPAGGGTWTPTGNPTTITVSGAARKLVINAVGAQKFYQVSVAAVSAAGTGQAATTTTPVTPTSNLAPGAVLLTPATMGALASDSSGTLTWSAPAPAQVQALAAGNVIVGPAGPAAPQGLLAKVLAVTRQSSGAYVVQTTVARLTDAFTNLAVAQSGEPSQLSSAQFTPALPGVRVLPHSPITLQQTITLALSLQGGPDNHDKVGLTLAVTPELSFDMQITQGLAGIPDGASVAASASVGAKLDVTASLNAKSDTWDLGTIRFPPIPVGPVEVTPEIPLELNASGSISVGVSWSMAIGAGMSWTTADPGTLTIQDLSQAPHLTGSPLPGVAAAASAELTLKAPVELGIFNAGGPDIEVDAGLKAAVNFNPPPGTAFFQVGPFVAGKIGFKFNFGIGPLNFDSSVSATLVRRDFPAFKIGSAPSADLVVSPADPTVAAGKSLTFTTTRSDGQHFAVSWLLDGAESGDSISSAGVLTVAAPAGRALTVVAFDSQGAQGQTQVTVGGESDPPGKVRATLGADGKSAGVSWQPPAHTGGYPLASYTVVTSPPTSTTTVPSATTSVHLAGLALGTLYQVLVYASNSGGLTSAPGSAYLVTPPPGSLTGLTALRAPLPANAAANPQVKLNAIACPAPGACVAVGSYHIKSGLTMPLIETETSGSWTAAEARLPSDAFTGFSDVAGLAAVACPAVGSCVATGYYRSTSVYDDRYLIERQSGITWTPSAAPEPKNALTHLTSAPAAGATQYVACPVLSACFDLTYYTDTTDTPHLLVETLSGSTWKATDVPLPHPAPGFPEPAPTLGGLACPSVSTCAAAGTYLAKNQNTQGMALALAGGKWTAANAPLPADASTTPSPTFTGVTCGSTAFCIAVGTYEVTGTGSNGLIEEFSHGAWTATEAPLPPDADSPRYSVLNAVSCAATGVCEAAGTYAGLNDGSSDQPPLNETLAHGTWVPGEGSLPANTVGSFGELYQLSCAGIGCVVLGTYGAAHNIQQLYVQSLATGPPSEARMPAGASSTPAPVPSPGGIACPAGGGCTAIGTYTDAGNNTQGFIETIGMAQ